MAHTFTNVLIHTIFSTKDRRPWIDAELKPRLLAYLGGIIREAGGYPLILDGTCDHVHGLLRLPHACSLSEMLRVVKTNSSRWVHQTWPDRQGFGWQVGYGAFSVSRSNVPAVIRYIQRQEEHHRKVSFQEEFVTFLKKQGITYDERYLWE